MYGQYTNIHPDSQKTPRRIAHRYEMRDHKAATCDNLSRPFIILQVFKLVEERLPRVKPFLDPIGYSSLVSGFANARYFPEQAMDDLTTQMIRLGSAFSIQVKFTALEDLDPMRHTSILLLSSQESSIHEIHETILTSCSKSNRLLGLRTM